MSETPETDTAWERIWGRTEQMGNAQDLSRKLERERDEARAALRELANVLETLNLIDLSPCNGGSCMIATNADDLMDAIKSRAAALFAKIKEGGE